MGALLNSRGFKTRTLLTKQATRDAVIREIVSIAQVAKPGNIFVCTNSSHVCQLPDLNRDESDGLDETICMYDGQLVDDEIYALLAKFPESMWILCTSDACHINEVPALLVVAQRP